MLTVVEKVILLHDVDVFSEVATEQLAYLAAIAEEGSFSPGHVVYREHDPADSMYLVIEGQVRLHRGDREIALAGPGDAFGTWALFDDEPRVTAATVLQEARLLRLHKEDFVDLLADSIGVTQGVLKALVRRVRGLIDRVGGTP
ncbi:MAG: Crp/Fnr family transcriptional regulator [Candidatus Latescibacterota bacterium]